MFQSALTKIHVFLPSQNFLQTFDHKNFKERLGKKSFLWPKQALDVLKVANEF